MLVTLDSSLRKPLYVQIRDQIRERILNGGLKPGDRLEPSRELAHQRGVHRTVACRFGWDCRHSWMPRNFS
jgi:DNA-binding transcriptional regulator YhcF (GntR family)